MIKNIALGICTAAILGAGALGLAGTAAAVTGPGYSYSPETFANPAATAKPGWHNNHGPAKVANLQGR